MSERKTSGAPPDPADREALLAKLEYLLIEVEALRPLLADLPDDLLEARPLDEPAILEAFQQMTARDRRAIHLVGGKPSSDIVADERIAPILDLLHHTRERLIDVLTEMGSTAWSAPITLDDESQMSLHEMVELIIEQDLGTLRAMGDRLRAARLSDSHRPGLL